MVKFCDNSSYIKELYFIHTNLSDFYFKTEECFYCYKVKESKPSGFIQFKISRLVVQILVIKTESEQIKKELLVAIIGFADQNHLSIEWRIISEVAGDNPFNSDFALAENLGFISTNILHIYSSNRTLINEAKEYIKHLKVLSDFVLKKGYTVCSFNGLSQKAKNYICDNPNNEFADYLDSSKHIKNNFGLFSKECSFVVLKDEKPIAFSVIRMLTKGKYILENICVSKNYRNVGAIAPLLYSSFNAIALTDYSVLTFAIYDENTECLTIVKKHFKELISQEKLQINYFL